MKHKYKPNIPKLDDATLAGIIYEAGRHLANEFEVAPRDVSIPEATAALARADPDDRAKALIAAVQGERQGIITMTDAIICRQAIDRLEAMDVKMIGGEVE